MKLAERTNEKGYREPVPAAEDVPEAYRNGLWTRYAPKPDPNYPARIAPATYEEGARANGREHADMILNTCVTTALREAEPTQEILDVEREREEIAGYLRPIAERHWSHDELGDQCEIMRNAEDHLVFMLRPAIEKIPRDTNPFEYLMEAYERARTEQELPPPEAVALMDRLLDVGEPWDGAVLHEASLAHRAGPEAKMAALDERIVSLWQGVLVEHASRLQRELDEERKKVYG